MGIDIKNFYLGTPLDRYEYMRIPISLFPQHIINQYNLRSKVKSGHVYLEIRKAIYGLPQAGILTNKQLREKLEPAGYYEVAHTPGTDSIFVMSHDKIDRIPEDHTVTYARVVVDF